MKSRPAVPSRTRSCCFLRVLCLVVVGIFDELSVDDVGESSLEAAQCLQGCLAGGELAAVVGAAVGVVTQLHDGGDVQHVVQPAVPGAGEPVPDLLTG